MNFQPHLARAIIDGHKTVTRRVPSDNPRSPWYRNRCGLEVGRTYAVCPGRGKAAVGHIVVCSVTMTRLGRLSTEEARREGFATPAMFLAAWRLINGRYDPRQLVWRIEFVLAPLGPLRPPTRQVESNSEPAHART